MEDVVELACDIEGDLCHLAQKVLRNGDVELDDDQRASLLVRLESKLDPQYRASLPPLLRGRADRLLRNVGDFLDLSEARRLARQQLKTAWRTRRTAAVNLLRRIEADEETAQALLVAAREHGDVQALEVAARTPRVFNGLGCCDVLSWPRPECDDYTGAVALTRMLADGVAGHEHSAATHPRAWVRALGRLPELEARSPSSHRDMLNDIAASTDDQDLLSLILSVAGRLRWSVIVDTVEARIRLEEPSLASLYGAGMDGQV